MSQCKTCRHLYILIVLAVRYVISVVLYQVLVESGEDVPQDYQLLVPDAKVAVPTSWLATILARFRSKEPKLVVTKMLDGFFTPWDQGKAGGASVLDPKRETLIKALECELFFNIELQLVQENIPYTN